MARSIWRLLLFRTLGTVCYIAGLMLLLVVLLDVYTTPPEGSLAAFSSLHILPLGVSVLLIVIGGFSMQKLGGGIGRRGANLGLVNESRMGYADRSGRSGMDPSSDRFLPIVDEDGQVHVICPACETTNEREYRFCSQCSSKLPA